MSPGPSSSLSNAINTMRRKNINNNLTSTANLLSILIVGYFLTSFQRASSLNRVLDLNGTFPYLINKTNGQVIEPRDYMDFDNIYAPDETYKREQTAQGRNYHLLKAFDFANYFQSDHWHYSDNEDLLISAHPVANESTCARQLDWLERKLNVSGTLFRKGQEHINLAVLMDAFGRPEAGTYLGHGHWIGSYYECKKVGINIQRFEDEEVETKCGPGEGVCKRLSSPGYARDNSEQLLKARYCIGKARDLDWPSELEENYVPRISYKVGLCLPESCETLSFRRHKAQIERLMLFNMAEYLKSRFVLDDIYCLPDERSPIRALSLSARIYVGICSTWLILSLLATWLYSNYTKHHQQRREQNFKPMASTEEQANKLKLSNGVGQVLQTNRSQCYATVVSTSPEAATKPTAPKNVISNDSQLPLVKFQPELQLALVANVSNSYSLCDGQQRAPINDEDNNDQRLVGEHHSEGPQSRSRYLYSTANVSAALAAWFLSRPLLINIAQALSISENMAEFKEPPLLLRRNKRLRINLNALDFIKCLCCILVIFGHVIFIHMQHLSSIIGTIEQSDGLAPRILISFFNFVDTFFIISGMLTAYFIFKRFNKRTFANPLVWLSITLFRLVRLSPVYILTFWFAKTLTVHLARGPIWDYGTDNNSIKGLCMNDHWWKSILYLGNLNTMQPLCILPAWSIILDAQYSIIIPPILFLILRHKRLGYISLLIGIVISTTNMSIQLATQTAVKTSDMAKVRLHVYPLISRFAAEFYNTPWNRLGPVAIGIMGGHLLYLYDLGKLQRWPWFMRGLAFKCILLMHLFILMLPSISLITDPPSNASSSGYDNTNLTLFVVSNATIKPIWSLINTILLLRLITDLRESSGLVRIMSHNIWHCLGKLCFVSYLIHYEIIMICLKSRREGLVEPTWWNAAREFSLVFMVSSFVAYFVYILFEAPINKLFTLAIVKQTYHQTTTKGNETGNNNGEEAGIPLKGNATH